MASLLDASRRLVRTAWFGIEIALVGRRDPATVAWIRENLEVVTGRARAAAGRAR